MNLKERLYQSHFGYELSQMQWFRKWYGGQWYEIIVKSFPYMRMWIKEKPNTTAEFLADYENWGEK